jgi:hypothetical protein
MPAQTQRPAPSSRPALTWRQADHDVFVAERVGAYAGHITADDAGFTVYDHVGFCHGVSRSLIEARALLENGASPFRRSDPASPRRRRGRRGPSA